MKKLNESEIAQNDEEKTKKNEIKETPPSKGDDGKIIAGIVLIVLQLMLDVGNLYGGGLNYFKNVSNFAVFIWDLIAFLTYSFSGSLGVILLIIGIKQYRKRAKGKVDEETSTSNGNEIEEAIPSNEEERR